MKKVKRIITKLKHSHYIVASIIAVILAGSIFCFISIKDKSNTSIENTAIISLSSSSFTNTLKKENFAFVIMGESQNDGTKLLLTDMGTYKKSHKTKVYYFDTSFYTQQINNSEEKELTAKIKEYQDFMNENKVQNLPCVVVFKDGKAIESSGEYLSSQYYKENNENKKTEIQKEATKNLNTWLKKAN